MFLYARAAPDLDLRLAWMMGKTQRCRDIEQGRSAISFSPEYTHSKERGRLGAEGEVKAEQQRQGDKAGDSTEFANGVS